MSQPTFSKGRKSRSVVPFPLGNLTDLVIAQDSQGALEIVGFRLIPKDNFLVDGDWESGLANAVMVEFDNDFPSEVVRAHNLLKSEQLLPVEG